MAKQKLTNKHVQLIKHLLFSQGWNCRSISDFIGLVGPKAISKIKLEHRWSEVSQPTYELGQELYFRFFRTRNFE